MATCSIFHNSKTLPKEEKSLILIGTDIKTGKYKDQIEAIRALVANAQIDEADKLKAKLHSFSPSATFGERRIPKYLKTYSGFIHLDFDHLDPTNIESIRRKIEAIPYTFMCFLSPRGCGLKVFIEVDCDSNSHKVAYSHVSDYYEETLGLKSDPKCKDIGRLCFMSYDPDLYKNLSNEKFKVVVSDAPDQPLEPTESLDHINDIDLNTTMLFQQLIEFTNRKSKYAERNRNNYIHMLASNCNRAGIAMEKTAELSVLYFDLPESEIDATVRSVYRNQSYEFGTFAKFAKSASLQTSLNGSHVPVNGDAEEGELIEPDYLSATPLIPDEVCQKLPSILRDGATVYTDRRKRDVFITGALAILSGCLPRVSGVYFQERVYPHLYGFIIAPAASGKGELKNAKRLAQKYHDQVLKNTKEEMNKYDLALLEYNEQKRKWKSGQPLPVPPKKPAFKTIMIPADCSYARMVELLYENGGRGIICETEADIMSGTKKQEWGDYSPLLRMAFHHEKYSYSRKGNNVYLEIEEPCIAMALAGTPGQVTKLIASAEDGLFSRILYYAYKSAIGWQDPSPRANPVVFNDHFNQLADEVLKLTKHLDQYPTEVLLTNEQWDKLNSSFTAILDDVVVFSSEDAAAVVLRLGLILYRFCMVFTALRKYEARDMAAQRYCSDEDFNSALSLIQVYLEHSKLMFTNLPRQHESAAYLGGENKRKFFESLPQEFQRKNAVKIGVNQFQLSVRTVDDILKLALNTKLEKLKGGYYRKK